jgi:hypothetical protein
VIADAIRGEQVFHQNCRRPVIEIDTGPAPASARRIFAADSTPWPDVAFSIPVIDGTNASD